jgi:hypothetical protein
VTNAMGRRARRDRRRSKDLPSEHDFSVAGIGISVIAVVVAVMFTV